ncbi:hypothetical protein VZG28_12745 [Synechococcus elongatus IITB4]|uniref:hypothetical protein n=1 Tax=Synechococcus elongatus TaxID=32046 RepID=UPI0030D25615
MKSLSEIYADYSFEEGYGDKGTLHSYIEIYENLFSQYRASAKSVLEIGIGSKDAYSLKMWRDFFCQAQIYGFDIDSELVIDHGDRITCYQGDQMNPLDLIDLPLKEGFDIVIDDGSHIPEHQIGTCAYLWPYVKSQGVYVIEDVANIDFLGIYFQQLKNMPKVQSYEVVDLRDQKNRFDDILIVLRKE